MRHGSQTRRRRSRSGKGNRGQRPHTHVYDSNGPDVRIRGTAHQVTEKYVALAKDAASSGDLVLAQSYLQHAEHYQRLVDSFSTENDAGTQQGKGSAGSGNAGDKAESDNPSKDDLSLPDSILGSAVDVNSDKRALAEI